MILLDYNVIWILFLGSLIYHYTPVRFKSYLLTFVSISILAKYQPTFCIYLIPISLLVAYAGKKLQQNKGIRFLISSIALLTVQLLLFKYVKGISEFYSSFFTSDLLKSIAAPIGISYFSFRMIAFVFDCYRGVIKEFEYKKFVEYIFFFPIFPAGPIETFQDYTSNESNSFNKKLYYYGIKRLIWGYSKKIILVNFVLHSYINFNFDQIISNNYDFSTYSSLEIISYLIIALIYSWLDLSAYADIAIGYGALFGKRISENMNLPIISRNLSEYWNRWHLTLSKWCKNNVYFPIMGKWRSNNIGLYSSFIVMGLWHDLAAKWFVWGIWHATGITVYSKWTRYKKKNKKLKTQLKKLNPKVDYLIGLIITLLYASLGFSFIMMKDLKTALLLLWDIIL